MTQGQNARTSLFLMEIIISVMFLSLCGAICVQIFVRAHLFARESVDVNNAMIWSQNLAESFRGSKGDIGAVEELYAERSVRVQPESAEEDGLEELGTLILFFDDKWEILQYPSSDISGVNASYEAVMRIRRGDALKVFGNDLDDEQRKLLAEYPRDVYTADIAVVDVKGTQMVTDIGDYMTQGRNGVISCMSIECVGEGAAK